MPRKADRSILVWVVFRGLIAGFIDSKIGNKTGEGFVLDMALGIIGAVVGGYLFNLFEGAGVQVAIYSLFVAVIGAPLVVLLSRRPSPGVIRSVCCRRLLFSV